MDVNDAVRGQRMFETNGRGIAVDRIDRHAIVCGEKTPDRR
jgi:hypothetical protein